MTTTTIQKWGNSYAMRLPRATVRKFNLHAGNAVEIREAVCGGTFSVVPLYYRSESLAKMVARITKKNSHSIVEWGRVRGKEIW